MTSPVRTALVREARFPADLEPLKTLIREYVRWLDMDLSYRGFEQEMDRFDTTYTLPSGMFFVAQGEGELAGCAGLLRHSQEVGEVKRLYVRPAYRGLALGEQLVQQVIVKAAAVGMKRLVLDAVPQTKVAQGLYERMGFKETAPYYPNPVAGTRFFAYRLQAGT